MKRTVFFACLGELAVMAALLALLVTSCALPNGGTINVERPGMVVHVEVADVTTGAAIDGATVRYWFKGAETEAPTSTTDARGTCLFIVPVSTGDSHMWVEAKGYVAQARHVAASPGVIVKWQLQKTIPDPPPLDSPHRGNFCGKRTPWGDTLFDIFLAVWTPEQRQWVYADKRADGLNRIYIAAKGDYHGDKPFDYTRNPAGLAALMQEVRANGFIPVVFMSSGDAGTGGDPDAYFGSLLDGLGPIRDQAEYSPCWECVKGGWTTGQFVRAVEIISAHVAPTTPIWFHGSDGRGTFASYISSGANDNPKNGRWIPNPDKPGEGVWIEADDPTNGDEPGAWKTPVGKRLAGLLYQSESGRPLLKADEEPLDYLGQRGWRGRALEVLMRVQDGQRGWTPKRVVLFETVGEDYYNSRATDADVTRIANEGAALGFREFGNGLPTKR